MVLVITEFDDLTSREVLEWVNSFGITFICIKPETRIELVNIHVNNKNEASFQILKDGKQLINSEEITAYWYRRGKITLVRPDISIIEDSKIKQFLSLHILSEANSILNTIYHLLQNKRSLGGFFNKSLNKILLLQTAQQVGLIVPDTRIIRDKIKLQEFKNENKNIVTKSIEDVIHVNYEGEYYTNYTELIDDDFIDKSPDTFFPTLFQEQIIKRYELRIFYIDGHFYSMAIFSQNDQQTKIDFRKYNEVFPNRTVAFKLPNKIEFAITLLMKKINLNTGSIDMLVSDKGEYVFLEINPVGQFGMVSHPCNYYLEKKVAEFLAS